MPIEHDFDPDRRILSVRMFGVVGDEDVLQLAKEITGDAVEDPVHDELIDLREVDAPIATTETLRRVAEMFRGSERQPESVKIAFVATSDAAYGIARMYQAFRSDSAASMRVFRELEEARAWLGLAGD
jgi:hypothetical protein